MSEKIHYYRDGMISCGVLSDEEKENMINVEIFHSDIMMNMFIEKTDIDSFKKMVNRKGIYASLECFEKSTKEFVIVFVEKNS